MSDTTNPKKGIITVAIAPDNPSLPIYDLLFKVMDADENVDTAMLFRIMKDGSVHPSVASRVVTQDLVATIARLAGETIQEVFRFIMERSESCNCPQCIARRGGVFVSPNPKAQV